MVCSRSQSQEMAGWELCTGLLTLIHVRSPKVVYFTGSCVLGRLLVSSARAEDWRTPY